jgi:hypothetical protein
MSSRDQKSDKVYAQLYLPKSLYDAIQLARKEKRRYNGRQFSNGLAFELGAQILLGIAENEEDILKQKLEDLEIHQTSINHQIHLTREQLERLEANNELIRVKGIKERQSLESLASKIVDSWDSIVLYKDQKNIDFIVRHFEGKLTRDKVVAVFPSKYEPAPTYEKAFNIASDLLAYEGDGLNV